MSTDLNNNKFIGKGVTFPIILNDMGRPNIETGLPLLESSLKMLIFWPKFTRFFLEKFGSRLEDVLEEPNDDLTVSLLQLFLKEAIQDYEKRIIISNVNIERVSSIKVNIAIRFYIRSTKIEETLIFPYYKELN
jgi:phage baseplate assembly protein W